MFGEVNARRTIAWLRELKWPPSEEGPLQKITGISWVELAMSWMHMHNAFPPVIRQDNLQTKYVFLVQTVRQWIMVLAGPNVELCSSVWLKILQPWRQRLYGPKLVVARLQPSTTLVVIASTRESQLDQNYLPRSKFFKLWIISWETMVVLCRVCPSWASLLPLKDWQERTMNDEQWSIEPCIMWEQRGNAVVCRHVSPETTCSWEQCVPL